MVCKTYCVFILATAPVVLSLKLQVDGKMDFGPKWNYEYRIKPLESETENSRPFTAIDGIKRAYVKAFDGKPRFIDIVIKNNKFNPRLVQVAEARIFDARGQDNKTTNDIEDGEEKRDSAQKIASKTSEEHQSVPFRFSDENPIEFSDEHTDTPKPSNVEKKTTKTEKQVHRLGRNAGNVDVSKSVDLEEFESPLLVSKEKNSYQATILMPGQKKKHKHKRKVRNNEQNTITDVKQKSHNQEIPNNVERKVTENMVSLTLMPDVETKMQDLYVKPRLVKDDPKIKEFTRHIYEQSLKTFESIKDKINSYVMKQEVDVLMRSYEDKFGDFVRETQNQEIRTKMGNQRVILNTLDTSNRILDRLVNYMIGKMDKKGILRNTGTENVILNELNKKKDLENKHVCAKMQICPTSESYTKFVVDILSIILSSPDNKIGEIRDACTEVLKDTDFSNVLDTDTEHRFLRGMADIEKYDVKTMKTIFSIIKNILSSKNSPIKVVGPEDSRVNKTLAFLDMLDNWDKKLPPNEQNVLEWNDMRNSFKEWSVGNRRDTVDLIQHFTDHVTKVISKDNTRSFDRNINTVLGF